MTSHKKMVTYLWNFSFWLHLTYNIWSFKNNTSLLRLMSEIFDILILRVSLWLLGTIHFHYKSLSLFPSQILVCTTAFASHYLFSLWDLTLVELFKQKNKKVGWYIGTSLCKSQDQQSHWLIIHDKFEDLFTTIT